MRTIRALRYPVLSMEDFLRHRLEFRLPPARSVVVTFDDGYADNRSAAHPILRRYGIPATIFVVTGAVGGSNDWDTHGELYGRGLMSWADLEMLSRDGIEVGAHAVTHVPLTTLPPDAMLAEARQSRDQIESQLRVEVRAFAYPHGAHDATSEAMAAQAGYLAACTTIPGFNDAATPAHALRRIDVRGNVSLLSFVLALWLGGAGVRRRWRETW
jgi:peptidoglycan/xylan/chitin deacetylase (PgdA/CDA1 family)